MLFSIVENSIVRIDYIKLPESLKSSFPFSEFKNIGISKELFSDHLDEYIIYEPYISALNAIREYFPTDLENFKDWDDMEEQFRPFLEYLFVIKYPVQPVDPSECAKILNETILMHLIDRKIEIIALYTWMSEWMPDQFIALFSPFVKSFFQLDLKQENLENIVKMFSNLDLCNWYTIQNSDSHQEFMNACELFESLHKSNAYPINIPILPSLEKYHHLKELAKVIEMLYHWNEELKFQAYSQILIQCKTSLPPISKQLSYLKVKYLDMIYGYRRVEDIVRYLDENSDIFTGITHTGGLSSMKIFGKPFLKPFPECSQGIPGFIEEGYVMSLEHLLAIFNIWSYQIEKKISWVAREYFEIIKYPNWEKILEDQIELEKIFDRENQNNLFSNIYLQKKGFYKDHYNVFAESFAAKILDLYDVDLLPYTEYYTTYSGLLLHFERYYYEWACMCKSKTTTEFKTCLVAIIRMLPHFKNTGRNFLELKLLGFSSILPYIPCIQSISRSLDEEIVYLKALSIQVVYNMNIPILKRAFMKLRLQKNVTKRQLLNFLKITDFSVDKNCKDVYKCLETLTDEDGFLVFPFPKACGTPQSLSEDLEYADNLEFWSRNIWRWAEQNKELSWKEIMFQCFSIFKLNDSDRVFQDLCELDTCISD